MKHHLGPLAQKRFLLPKTRVLFKLIPNRSEFLLKNDPCAAVATYSVYIKGIKLKIRTVELSPQVATQIYRNLQKPHAIHPMPMPIVTSSVIDNGLYSWEKGNIFTGKVVKLLMFAIVKNSAFNISLGENPFNYRNLRIQEVRIYIDGIPVIQPIHTDFRHSTHPEAFLRILNAAENKSCLLNSQT